MTKFAKVTAMTAALIMCGAVNAATITLDGTNLTIEDAWKIANNEADVAIAPKAMKLLEDSYKLVLRSAASGQQVTGPEGVYFGTDLVQWDERFAFVEQTFMSGENCFIPVDVSGRVYDEFSQKWDRIYASPGGKVYGVKEIKGDRGLTDHCEVTPLEITLS